MKVKWEDFVDLLGYSIPTQMAARFGVPLARVREVLDASPDIEPAATVAIYGAAEVKEIRRRIFEGCEPVNEERDVT